MEYDVVVLTKHGFKMVSDLVPNKDYVVTKSGKYSKFLGFEPCNDISYQVWFNTNEMICLSGDTLVDNKKDETFNLLDIDMINNKIKPVMLKNISPLDFKSPNKVGLSREECYEIGYRKNFDRLKDIDFTRLSLHQRKYLIAGLIDNGETIFDNCTYTISNLNYDIRRILIFILRSLSYNVCGLVEGVITFSINMNVGLLPLKTGYNLQTSLYASQVSSEETTTSIFSTNECQMKPGVWLKVDIDEPILVGYSLIPIIQKGEN